MIAFLNPARELTESSEKTQARKEIDIEQQLSALVQQFRPLLIACFRRFGFDSHTVDDLIQQTWIDVWTDRSSFDSSRKFKQWLTQIARRNALDEKRRRRITTSLDADDSFDIESAEALEQAFDRSELSESLWSAVSELSPDDSALVQAVFVENKTHLEVSRERYVSRVQVTRRIGRIAAKLGKQLHSFT